MIAALILGDVARHKYNELISVTQNRRAKSESKKATDKLKAQIAEFDENNIPKSMVKLARASHKVKSLQLLQKRARDKEQSRGRRSRSTTKSGTRVDPADTINQIKQA